MNNVNLNSEHNHQSDDSDSWTEPGDRTRRQNQRTEPGDRTRGQNQGTEPEDRTRGQNQRTEPGDRQLKTPTFTTLALCLSSTWMV
ncbi:hypothetical protein EYF80_056504 [Liparis tanakae]|uniref:Uncharacterized protein n=1 Tax=Liparis tanakae TaxID=230148 RepID=A0A4Z2EX51_9TELE|nr:hypothetical protein EYF80_056504 [Liparis tanakae]